MLFRTTVSPHNDSGPVAVALEAALLVMRNGGSTVAADRALTNILKGCQQEAIAAVFRLDFIAVTHTVGGQPSTMVRPIGPIKVNLVRASALTVLGEQVATGAVSSGGIEAEIERIRQLASPYNRWWMMVAAVLIAASYSQILGGDTGSLGVACVAAGVGQWLRSHLYSRDLATERVTLICGALSATIAGLGVRLGLSQVEPATLLAAVTHMVPGLPLINGFVDVASQKHLLVGVERIAQAAFVFVVLAIAIAFARAVVL